MNCSSEFSTRTALDVFVMEVDMSRAGEAGCQACDTTTARVKESVEQLRPVLDAVGVEVRVDKLRVSSDAEARALGLRASPMIRIGGIELAPEHRDIPLNGSEEEFETMRLWHWQGQAYRDPPLAMLLDALLRAYATNRTEGATPKRSEIPSYVQQYLSPGGERASAAANTCSSGCG